MTKSVQILLVDDSPTDVDLTIEAFSRGEMDAVVSVVGDGVEAMDYLRRAGKYDAASRPALMLLDLNMPRMDGREVLARMKEDPTLKDIPVVVLSSSKADRDITASYRLHANCYVVKPGSLAELAELVRTIEQFWFTVATIPRSHA